jgi:GMP synthase (glutamine-hydrolysing)
MRTLVLQHIACEPPGAYEDVLIERGARLTRVELDAGERLPDWREFDAIVTMGGPMSVNDDIGWLIAEKAMIAEAVRAGKPFFGACLGSQLLAASLGARVYTGPAAEVGLLPVTLSDAALADPVFSGLPRELLTLQWHGDTFELPDGAVALASSPAYANQAFRWGARAYAVQFHLEVTPGMAREWSEVPEYAESLERTLGAGAFPALLRELDARGQELRGWARRLFAQWLDAALAPCRAQSTPARGSVCRNPPLPARRRVG